MNPIFLGRNAIAGFDQNRRVKSRLILHVISKDLKN